MMFYQHHFLLLLGESSVELSGGTKLEREYRHTWEADSPPTCLFHNQWSLPAQSRHYLSETSRSVTFSEHTSQWQWLQDVSFVFRDPWVLSQNVREECFEISYKKEKQTRNPISKQDPNCIWYSIGKGKSVFSRGVALGISATIQGRPHTQV